MSEDEIPEDDQSARPEEAVYDTSNATQVGKRTRELKLHQTIVDDGFKEVVSSVESRAWLWSLLSDANVFSSTFSIEPAAYGLAEGKRSLGLAIMADIQRLCPEMLATMMRENQEKAYG